MRVRGPVPNRPLLVLLIATAALTGCAASRAAHPPAATATAGPRPRVAMLPLEDLSGQSGVADRLTRIAFTALALTGAYEVVEPGQVDDALSEARVRSTGMLSQEQVATLVARLQTHWLLTGSALEYGHTHTPDGDVPSVGIALRLIDGRSGRVRWADQRFRNGDDHETVFGWGREDDADRLAQHTLTELLQGLRIPADDETTTVTKEARR